MPTNYLKGYTLDGNTRTEYEVDALTLEGMPQGTYITVTPDGSGDHTTIGAAIAVAPVGGTILVFPGTYNEDITIDNNIKIQGLRASLTIKIVGSTTTSTRVTFAGPGTLGNVSVTGPSSGVAPSIDVTALQAGELAILDSVALVGGGAGSGVVGAGSGILAVINGGYHNGGTFTGALYEATGGTVVLQELVGNVGSCADFLKVSGGVVEVQGIQLQSSALYTCTDFLDISGGDIEIIGLQTSRVLPAPTNNIHVTGGPIVMELMSCNLYGSTYDFLVDPAVNGSGSTVMFAGCTFRQENSSAPAIWSDNLGTGLFNYNDPGINNDPIVRVGGSFAAGAAVRPAASYFGGGSDITQLMQVRTYDGVSTYIDETADAASASGSTFSLQGTAAGNILYVGWALAFPAFYADVTTKATMTNGFGDGVWEYWNGAQWQPVSIMTATADAVSQRCSKAFEEAGMQYIRFDVNMMGDWASTAVDGVTAFWVRWRLTQNIVTAPVFERIKIATNRSEMASSGFIQFFGTGEPKHELTVHQRLHDDLVQGSPGNKSLALATGVSITPIDNQYNNGQDDGVGMILSVPEGLDTSRDLTVKWGWIPLGDNTGDVRWKLRVVNPITIGDNIDSGNLPSILITQGTTYRADGSTQINQIPNVNGNFEDQLFVTEYSFKITDAEPGTFFAIALTREDSSDPDPFGANVAIAFVEAYGTAWKLT